MIKIGILGASTPIAGELIRILVNHPDVIVESLYEPALAGMPVVEQHYGLIAECDANFTDQMKLARLDAVIACSPSDLAAKIISSPELYPNLRVIDLTGSDVQNMALGVGEVNRKPLVRGAKRAYIPTAPAVVAMIMLYPLASALMLNSDISISVTGRADSDELTDALQVSTFLAGVQNSFVSSVVFNKKADQDNQSITRGIRLQASVPAMISAESARKIYEDIYDDHNFTHLTRRPMELREVEGTQKCLIALDVTPDGILHIDAVADGLMRGGAGDAIHVMNLLFGLHERTGLALKATNY